MHFQAINVHGLAVSHFFFLGCCCFLKKEKFIYLAVLGLSRSMGDLVL